MNTETGTAKVARRPYPYWKIIIGIPVIIFVALFVRHGFRVPAQMIETWGSATAAGLVVYCGLEAWRRRAE